MELRHNKCLLLNADFSPLSVISWKKAIIWHIKYQDNPKYGIDIIDFYKDDYIQCANNKKYPIPTVAKTKKFYKTIYQNVVFSRKNIFIRDNFTCQYCSKILEYRDLTYDHVIPKALWDYNRGTPTNWTNIVTSCVDCNRKKGNRTPKQANMHIKNLPIKPAKNQLQAITTCLSPIISLR
jgi:5-methylcytosine-specific restriction endonuclease McrA